MAVTKIHPIKSTLKKALDYIENPDKTEDKMLVSSFGCSYETADIEFEVLSGGDWITCPACPPTMPKKPRNGRFFSGLNA